MPRPFIPSLVFHYDLYNSAGSFSASWSLQTNVSELPLMANRVPTFWLTHAAWRGRQEDWGISVAGLCREAQLCAR